jgi:hypothetical protein
MAGPHLITRIVTRAHALSTGEPRTKLSYNVWDFYRLTGAATPTKTQISAAFVTAIAANLKTVMSVSYVTDFIDTRFLDDPLDANYTAVLAQSGTVSGDSLPSVNSVTLQLKTGFRGRINRGSKHFGPIAESATLIDELTSAAQTAWDAFCATYLAGFTDAAGVLWRPYLVSQKNSVFTPTVATVVGNPITEITANSILGIMRRRKQRAA